MLTIWRGYPTQLRLDNGPEFISQNLEFWADDNDVDLAFIQPGKPAQNAYRVLPYPASASNASTELSGKMSWMLTYLIRLMKCKLSLMIGWKNTMPFGHTNHWEVFRPININPNSLRFSTFKWA